MKLTRFLILILLVAVLVSVFANEPRKPVKKRTKKPPKKVTKKPLIKGGRKVTKKSDNDEKKTTKDNNGIPQEPAYVNELKFPPSASDIKLLDELNMIRTIVATGVIAYAMDVAQESDTEHDLDYFYEAMPHYNLTYNETAIANETTTNTTITANGTTTGNATSGWVQLKEWGYAYYSTSQVLQNEQEWHPGEMDSRSLDLAFQNYMNRLDGVSDRDQSPKFRKKRFIHDILDTIGNAFNKIKNAIANALFKIPKKVLGPASNMHMLKWNRRLAQLAILRHDAYERGQREIEYEGKTYRMFKYGSLLQYIIENVVDNIGVDIRFIFKIVNVGILAVTLILSGVDAPITHLSQVEDSSYEALFADRYELGCFQGYYCIIGPITNRTGNFYNPGKPCTRCETTCSKGLCHPPPDYSLHEKYEEFMDRAGDLDEIDEETEIETKLENSPSGVVKSGWLAMIVAFLVVLIVPG
uniref:Uncharacterized protein n=1 Tax=Caenorhabditis japonica TaxID=281687 RepID=A0A8R1HW41_CAEJA